MNGMVIVLMILMFVYLALIGIAVASYVMNSLSLYTLAQRRQIKNPWLAWIPMANFWIMGCLADDYDSRREIKTNWKKTMLALSIVFIGLYVMFIVVYVLFIATTLAVSYMYNGEFGTNGGYIAVMVVYIVTVIMFALCSTALMGCQYICLFKIFESTIPDKAVKYFLLYLLVPLAGPICLMKCKDKGYDKIVAAAVPAYVPAPAPDDIEAVAEEIVSETEATDEAE